MTISTAPTYEVSGLRGTVSEDGYFYINCVSITEADEAAYKLPEISTYAEFIGATQICIRIPGKVVLGPIPVSFWNKWKAMQSGKKLIWSREEVIAAIYAAERQGRCCSVIRMSDDKNLFTTSAKLKFGGIPADDWTGKSSRAYFTDDQFDYYIGKMYEDPGQLVDVNYRARKMLLGSDKPGEERRFFCQARMFQDTNRVWYRMNYTLSDKPVTAF